MQKFIEEETGISLASDGQRVLARSQRVLRSMSMNTRDKNGYPLEGIDVVPIRPKKPNKMAELMKLL